MALATGCVLELDNLAGPSAAAGAAGSGAGASSGGDGATGGDGASTSSGGTAGQGGSSGGGGSGGSQPEITVSTVDTWCPDGRILDARKWKNADDVVLQIHCTTTPTDCSVGTTLAGLGEGPDCAGAFFAQHDGCPAGLASASKEYWFYSAHHGAAGVQAYEDLPKVAPLSLSVPGKRIVAMTGSENGGLTYVVGPEAGGGPTEIWVAGQAQPMAAWSPYEVTDLDGYFVVGAQVATGTPVLIMAGLPPALEPDTEWELVECETPARVEHHQKWVGSGASARWEFQDRVVATCDGALGGRVYATEPLQGQPMLRSMALPGVHPSAVALSLSGDQLWVWDEAGKLTKVDIVTMTVLDQWSLPASYPGAAMARLPSSDELVLGGPTPGVVTLLHPGPGAPRCESASQQLVH